MNLKLPYLKWTTPLLCSALLFACSPATDQSNTATTKVEVQNSISNTTTSTSFSYDAQDFYQDWQNENPIYIELDGDQANFPSTAPVIFQDQILTIKTGGTYVISGKLADGQLVVDAEDKNTVRLIFNGLEIHSSNNAAIFVKKAKKTVISLEEGTENIVSDGQTYVNVEDDEPNAAIFSKDNLTINGAGSLTVLGNYNNGIACRDDLKITGGNITIQSADDGLRGRDLVAVKDVALTITAGGDGIKSTNDKDESKGLISLEGGTFDIRAEKDGIQAIAPLLITNGSYTITSGGGSPEIIKTNMGHMPGSRQTPVTTVEQTDTNSGKGLKSSRDITITGGTFAINSADDAIHSNHTITIHSGEFAIYSGDDGIHADSSIDITGGTVTIDKSYEGIESKVITITDGTIHVTSGDDGINISGGNDGSGLDMFASSEGSLLQINGGYLYVNANGDGLDSNGSIVMTGGTVIVNGPTSNGNGSLDYNGSFDLSGGFLITAGSSGMVQTASEQSKQNSIVMTFNQFVPATTLIHLKNSKDETIATFAPSVDYQSIYISSPNLTSGQTYSLYTGGTTTGSSIDGLYTDGAYQAGNKIVEFTITDPITWLNEAGVTTAQSTKHGGPGKMEGNRNMMFGDLSEETRAKVEAILDQERAGTITREEAQVLLAELGVDFPHKGMRPSS